MNDFKRIFSSNAAIMLLVDAATGDIADANNSALEFYGYTHKTFLTLNVSDINILPAAIVSEQLAAINKGKIIHTFYQHRISSGAIKDVQVFVSPVETGGVKMIFAIIQDVTIQKIKEAESNLFRQIADHGIPFIGIASMNREVFYLNQSMRTALAVPENADLSKYKVFDFYSAKGKEVIKNVFSEIQAKGYWKGENEMQSLEGRIYQVLQSIVLIRDEEGKPQFTSSTAIDITETKLSEKRLQQSESRFRAIMESSFDAIGVHVNGIWEMCNPAALKLFGYSSSEELIGKPILNVIALEEHKKIKEYIHIRMQGKEGPEAYLTQGLKKDGSVFDMEVSLSSFTEAGILHVMVILRDITERRKAQALVAASLNRFKKIASRVPGVVYQYRLRPDGTACFPFASEAINEIYRVTPEEVRKDASIVFTRLHPDDVDEVAATIQQSAKTLKPWQHEYRVKFEDGTVRSLFGNAVPELEEDGSVLWHGFITDITDRKKAAEKIVLNEARLKLATTAGKIGVWDWDIPKNILSWDDSMYRLYGLKKNDFNGAYEAWTATLHEDDRAFVEEEIQAAIRGEKEYAPEFRIVLSDGTVRMIKADSQTIFDESGKAVRMIGTNIDMTERRQIEDQLRQSEENLKQAELIGGFGYWRLDLNTHLFEFSKGAAEIYGIDEGKGMRDELIKLRLPEYNDMMDEAFKALIEDDKPYDLEYKIKRKKDGKIIDIHIISTYNKKEQIVFGSVQNITAHKQAEAELKQSEEKFKHLIEEMNTGVILQDPATEILLNNRKALELLGLSQDQLLGKTSFDPDWNVFHEDGSPFPGETHPVSVAIATKAIVKNIVMGVYHPVKKERVWLLVNAVPELNEEGGIRQVIVTFTDITENREKQEALKRSELNLRNAQQIGHIGNWIWNIIDNKMDWSDEMFNIYKIRKESFSGKLEDFIASLIHPEDRRMVEQFAKAVIENGKVVPFEHRIILNDGNVRYLAVEHGELKKDSAGNPETLTGTTQDITEQKIRELDIERLNNELKELAKYLQVVRAAERDRLAIEVHDKLGQRLVFLRYHIDQLKSYLQEKTGETLSKIDDLSTTVIEMIQDFKKLYYEVNPTLLVHFGLYDSIEYLTTSFKKKSGVDIKFTSNMEGDKTSDLIKLALYKSTEGCLDNILQHANATQVSVNLFKEDHLIRLEIADDGVGFDLSAVDTSRHHGIVEIRERVNTIGGKLIIDSVRNVGTKVKILLSI